MLCLQAAADSPPGVSPGRPLFIYANDLEIDFPRGNALELLRGETAVCSNCYIQA
jgi:hypothetical protein